jgi:putative salt-induced outer membrane protein
MKEILILIMMFVMIEAARAQLTNETEAGLASATGNTRTKTINYKQLNTYTWRDNVLRFNSRYLNASANSVETARFFEGGLRYERRLTKNFNMFIGELYQSDKFAGIQNRYISDLGGKYFLLQSDETKLFSELGYRHMKEERYSDTSVTSSYGRFYTEWENKWNENFATKYWVEYLPNFTEAKDWQANTEFSLSAILTKVFSLKTGVLIRYDHSPAPGIAYKEDTLFTTALVAKF